VTFGYDGAGDVLREVSFTVAPGHVLGVVGRTGSGKTTIARLVVRLWEPGSGSVLLGGVDVRDLRYRELRSRVGVVTQDVQLFSASLRDNLTLFEDLGDDHRILEVIGDLGLLDWYSSLPDGLDTQLGAGGTGVSAGEAQLLAFGRVFLRDPGLVILDEASSRLDPVTEGLIERAVDRLLTGRTAVVIAHRLRTVNRADEILILEDGRVAELGSRAALQADPGSRFSALLRAGLEDVLG
jgi:ATP-binding cassette subfamily B protein